ncbi:MAG: DUF423 domain-containing protein [Flavobacterium sp.]|nr:MAG: DUF423 domain-containing protein [Flavobacterium sp.]
MERKIIATAAFLGMTAVILGAFGAHGLKPVLEPEHLSTFETSARYQMYHAILLLFVGLSTCRESVKRYVFYLVLIGIIFFSGSIYLLSTAAVTGIAVNKIGIITPIGGLLLIIGWLMLFIEFIRKKS